MKKCDKHPKYKGKRLSKNQCTGCLALYVQMGKMIRKPLSPATRVHKDKSKYTRKRKHKDAE